MFCVDSVLADRTVRVEATDRRLEVPGSVPNSLFTLVEVIKQFDGVTSMFHIRRPSSN